MCKPEIRYSDVKEIIEDMKHLWNSGNRKGYCDYYAPTAAFYSANSGPIIGRGNILLMYRMHERNAARMGKLALSLKNAWFPDNNPGISAVASVYWILETAGKPAQVGRSALTFERIDGQTLITTAFSVPEN